MILALVTVTQSFVPIAVLSAKLANFIGLLVRLSPRGVWPLKRRGALPAAWFYLWPLPVEIVGVQPVTAALVKVTSDCAKRFPIKLPPVRVAEARDIIVETGGNRPDALADQPFGGASQDRCDTLVVGRK